MNNGREVKNHISKIHRSALSRSSEQQLRHLALQKMHKTVEMPDNDAVRGMIQQVRHLVKVEEI